MIDHHMINRNVFSHYIENSARVLDTLTSFVTNFVNTTSDHFPVLSYYNFNQDTTQPVSLRNWAQRNDAIQLWPNPNKGNFFIDVPMGNLQLTVYDLSGRSVHEQYLQEQGAQFIVMQEGLRQGLYLIKLTDKQGYTLTRRILIQ
jgi:hypothetical protein